MRVWFPWERDPYGYRVDKTPDGAMLVPKTTNREIAYPLGPQPRNEVAFEIFARIERAEDVVTFADRFGPLYGHDPEHIASQWFVARDTVRSALDSWRRENYSDLVSTFSELPIAHASLAMRPSTGAVALEPCVQPDSLRNALLWQLADAIKTDLKIRNCAWCDTPFAYGAGTGRRKTAIYCSGECQRAHAYRKKQEASK